MVSFFSQLYPLYPELMLAGGALFLVLLGAFYGERSANLVHSCAIAFLLAAGFLLCRQAMETPDALLAFNGSFRSDAFGRFLKMLILIASIGGIVLAWRFQKQEKFERFEYSILIVLSVLGMCVMLSAGDLIALYLGLELQSLALYVVASMHRDHARSSEAGLKYFVLGSLSSGMLLYGCSLIYGVTGSVQFGAIAQAIEPLINGETFPLVLVFGLVFVLAGLAFKISAVPFHMWTPDVYEGAPSPVTAFFASAPKVAGLAILIRFLFEAFPNAVPQWQQVIFFVAVASMILGAFAGIAQTNIKRLMAYSSIGHVGYALVGLAAATPEGVQGVVMYLVIYVAMTLGVFACIIAMRTQEGTVEKISDLAGLSKHSPLFAAALCLLFFSLAGIPPLAGFFGKFYVFKAAMDSGLYALSIIGVLASVVSAFYYLRIVKIMYFDEPSTVRFVPLAPELKVVLALSIAFVLFYIAMPTALDSATAVAAKSLF